ncbi:MAG: sigma-70 family RNA polymerase sigma factor [Caulobacterales bacterium]
MADPVSLSGDAAREHYSALLEAVGQHRDPVAFAALFAYFAPRVKAFLRRLSADDALAEEITQDVMVTVWRKAALYDRAQSSASTWIFRVARNRRIDAARRAAKPSLDADDPAFQPSAPAAPDDALETLETEVRVRDGLKALPHEQALLLRLAFYEGLSHAEIAERTKIPLGTVKSRIRLAFNKLRGRLGEAGDG